MVKINSYGPRKKKGDDFWDDFDDDDFDDDDDDYNEGDWEEMDEDY